MPTETKPTQLTITKEEFTSLVGEGLHAGLRKGSEAPSSATLWQAIADSQDSAWEDALEYMAWGLEYMGLVKFKEDES